MRTASEFVRNIWGDDLAPVHLQRSVVESGGYLTTIRDGGEVIAFAMGFLGQSNGALVLHSHLAAVAANRRHRGLGFLLKQHQRTWCLERGIPTVVWTFDPLMTRNAYFNITKLGATSSRYETDFYGEMQDVFNGGDRTDRLVVRWELARAAEGRARALRFIQQPPTGAQLLTVGRGAEPHIMEPQGDVLICDVHPDVQRLRSDPDTREVAAQWRHAVRETVGSAVDAGYALVAATRGGRYYLTLTTNGG